VLRARDILAGMRPGSSGAEILGRGLDRMRSSLPLAAEMGLNVLSGTDLAVPSRAVGREAAALTAAGLPVAAALAGLTAAGRSANGVPAGFRAGLSADVVAFDSDPRSDLSTLTRPSVVLHAGRTLLDRR
jgi:imidazolonepropionase-like amidohydrolase